MVYDVGVVCNRSVRSNLAHLDRSFLSCLALRTYLIEHQSDSHGSPDTEYLKIDRHMREMSLAVPDTDSGRPLPSDRTIALALSIVLSKPEELRIEGENSHLLFRPR